MDVKRYCVSLLEKFGSFEYTRQTLIQLDLDARREIEKLGGNPILERVLDELKNWWDCWDSIKKTEGSRRNATLIASGIYSKTNHNSFKYLSVHVKNTFVVERTRRSAKGLDEAKSHTVVFFALSH